MSATEYVFAFDAAVLMQDVLDSLHLARLAAEALHGAERVELGVSTAIDVVRREVAMQASNPAGTEMAIVFLGYARREFGPDAVRVRRVLLQPTPPS